MRFIDTAHSTSSPQAQAPSSGVENFQFPRKPLFNISILTFLQDKRNGVPERKRGQGSKPQQKKEKGWRRCVFRTKAMIYSVASEIHGKREQRLEERQVSSSLHRIYASFESLWSRMIEPLAARTTRSTANAHYFGLYARAAFGLLQYLRA